MGLEIFTVTGPKGNGVHCKRCNKTFKKGEKRIDILFGSGWPQPRVMHPHHFHVKCFVECWGTEIEELYLAKRGVTAGKKNPEINPDARVDGVLETMEKHDNLLSPTFLKKMSKRDPL